MDYYIKSTDEAALWAALESAGLATKQYDTTDPLNQPTMEKEWVPTGAFTWISNTQLDIIGTIYVPTEETTLVEGFPVPVMVALDGFHANLRAQLTTEQQSVLPLIDAPSTPSRVWA